MRLRPIREADVLSACLSLLRIHGWVHWRQNTGQTKIGGRIVRFGKIGASDIIAVVPRSGRILACECKRPGGRPTAAQEAFLCSVAMNGGIAAVVSSCDRLEALLGILEDDPWADDDAIVGGLLFRRSLDGES